MHRLRRLRWQDDDMVGAHLGERLPVRVRPGGPMIWAPMPLAGSMVSDPMPHDVPVMRTTSFIAS
jgi:hypothetical protein